MFPVALIELGVGPVALPLLVAAENSPYRRIFWNTYLARLLLCPRERYQGRLSDLPFLIYSPHREEISPTDPFDKYFLELQ
jgi:hypothetical protein